MSQGPVWYGRVEVRPRPGNRTLGDAPGAVVNVLCRDLSADAYRQRVREALSEAEFEVVDISNVRAARPPFDFEGEEMNECAREAFVTGEVCWTTFYSFEADEET